MSIKIIKPGIFTTIQDLGRFGHRAAGIGPGGAMDFFAASTANISVGNDENCPVIEMHFPAAEMLFDEDTLVSITGANFGAHVNDAAADLWKRFIIKRNSRLSFKRYINGARVYLAMHGQMEADKWLNSFSTHTKINAGGYLGRILKKDDVIKLDGKTVTVNVDSFSGLTTLIDSVYEPRNIIRCIAGPEWELLNHESKNIFPALPFTVTNQSDRMGFRLKGINLSLEYPDELISSPVDSGTIQLLPNGQLIVLMADHQTTGGYPRIANVISADLPKLAQSPVHSELKFEVVNTRKAEDVLFSLYQKLEIIKNSI